MSVNLARAQLEQGLVFHRQQQLGLAQSHYQRAVKLDAKNADAWHLLGLVSYQMGIVAKAIKNIRQAIALRPNFAEAWNNLGTALKENHDFVAAEQAFAKALEVRPEYVEAAYNLGILLTARGEFERAQVAYQRAHMWRPDSVPVLTNLGNLLRKTGQFEPAKMFLMNAARLAPNATTYLNLAQLLIDLGQSNSALDYALRAQKLEPDSIDVLAAVGSAARLENELSLALSSLRKIVTLTPKAPDALHELALCENSVGNYQSARELMARALALAPDNERLRWHGAFLLPTLVKDSAECVAAIDNFAQALAQFKVRTDWAKSSADAILAALVSTSSFDLAYLPGDTLPLQLGFGALISQVLEHHVRPRISLPVISQEAKLATPAKKPGTIRVGVISSYLRQHTVMRYFAGLLEALCADARLECWVWYSGAELDRETEALQAQAQQFFHVITAPLQTIADVLHADLDIMIYPDLGMDSQQQLFAAWRLARKQIVLYGHPVSSGLPAVDAYFSAAALEAENAAQHYCEQLVRLPALGAALRLSDAAATRAAMARAPAQNITLICAQNLAKLTPEFDLTVSQILARSSAQLQLFDRQPLLSANYLARLNKTLAAHGVAASRVTLLPACAYPEFLAHLHQADVVLDSPWFSGGATSIDALSVGTPVLTWQADFARARQTAGMLGLMDAPELIALDAADFVEKALALIANEAQREHWRSQLRRQAHRLFTRDAEVIFVDQVLALLSSGAI
jgi:protein O-GlcNAc transferase